MTNTIKIPEGHELKKVGENSYEIVPIETNPRFKQFHCGFVVESTGTVGEQFASDGYNRHHSVFRARKDAEDVARYQKVFNAVCRAVKQVDPDFVPDWGAGYQSKWVPEWDGDWCLAAWGTNQTIFPPVESRAKCEEVIALLEAEGIVPVGVDDE